MHTNQHIRQVRLIFVLLILPLLSAAAFDPEDYEEPAGMSVSFMMNPKDGIYGLSFEDGTWLVGTPLMGQLMVSTYRHGVAESYYGGLGMIFRLMPRTRLAPYAGAGASYNWAFGSSSNKVSSDEKPVANSYWGGHAEAGVRIWTARRDQFFELSGRQTWNLDDNRLNFWSIGISYGQGW